MRNSHIAASITSSCRPMRSLAVLFSLLILSSPFALILGDELPNVGATSLSSCLRTFHLHEGVNLTASNQDWLNSTGPQNPSNLDYDVPADGLFGVTIKKNVPPQRFHSWILYPSVNEEVVLSGDLSASLWVRSQGNESGTLVKGVFLDITSAQFADPYLGTEIGSATVGLVGPFYNQFQLRTLTIPSVSYTIPAGHFLALAVERGDPINDWLIVNYDRTDYDSYVTLRTSTFISVDQAWTEDLTGVGKSTFSDAEQMVVKANISNPFGAYDTKGANVSLYNASDGSLIMYMLTMQLNRTDASVNPSWKIFEIVLPVLSYGDYRLNVTGRDAQGRPSWINLYVSVITVHHFGVSAPTAIAADGPFSVTVSALNQSNGIVRNWTGTVQLVVYRDDMSTVANGTLSTPSVTISYGDNGTVTLTDEVYNLPANLPEEDIYIRAFLGSKSGWSGMIHVSTGPVTSLLISPAGTVTVNSGEHEFFNVTGIDSGGHMNTTWTPFWTVTSGIGVVSQFGKTALFDATTAGSGNLTCRNNVTGAYANVSLVVIPGGIARIEIISPTDPLQINESESVALSAVGYDLYDNVITLTSATWDTTTTGFISGGGASVTYTAGMIPETGQINVRQSGASATLNVTVLPSPKGPWINPIPQQIYNEDIGSWPLSLSQYWQDVDGPGTLSWWVEDVNTSLYFVAHDPASLAVMQFYTQPNQFGEDEFVLWVVDSEGYRASQVVSVKIRPVNDAPRFVNDPPEVLWVKFDTPYTFDFSYYVSDVDNDLAELYITPQPSETSIEFYGVVGTFMFAREIGEFEIVTLVVMDPDEASGLYKLPIRGTDDTPPDLVMNLPDVNMTEGTVNYSAFDLDDYFLDVDGDDLYFSYGFHNIVVNVDQGTGIVNFSAPYEWSGITMGTLTARDNTGAIRTDTVLVNVTAVNDPPEITLGEDPIYVKHDVVYYLYLSQYVRDPDNSIDTLIFSLNCSYITHAVSPSGAHRLEMLFPANLSGPVFTDPYSVNVRMDVSDGEMQANPPGLFSVVVTDNSPPTVIAGNPNELYYDFPEETWLNDTLMLYDIFYDADDESLIFDVESGSVYDHLTWYVDSRGVVNLTADVNWSGTQQLKITARDSDKGWSSLLVTVVVTPVNDRPVIDGNPNTPEIEPILSFIVIGGERSSRYYIGDYIVDSDNNWSSDLTFIVHPSDSVQIVGGYLYFTLPSDVDVITVALQVYDGNLNSNVASFDVGVEKTWAEKIGWPYSFPLVLLAAGVVGYFAGMRLPKPFALENLFLIHNDGRLVSHVTKEENTNLDKDVVSAMFTAVQDFVRDSFQKGEVGLRKLEIGDKNVVIEKGKSAYLALIYSGWPPKEKFEMLAMLLRDIEERYKKRLERWNGTLKSLGGVDKMLQDYMGASYTPGIWQEEAEIAEEEWVEILEKQA